MTTNADNLQAEASTANAQPAQQPETPAGAGEPAEGLRTPHASRLEEIVARRREQQEAELATFAEMTGQAPAQPVTEDDPAQPAAAAADPIQPQAQNVPPAAGTPPVAGGGDGIKLLVNGREVVMSQDELVRNAQRGLSADERFREAARMREEAARIMGMAPQQPQQQFQQPQAQPQYVQPQQQPNAPAAQRGPIIPDDRAREIVERINYGSAEEQAAAIQDLVATAVQQATGQGNSLTPEQVYALGQRAALDITAQAQFNNDLMTIGNEYPEVINDRPLMVAAADQVRNLRLQYQGEGIVKSNLEIYREACGFIKERYLPSSQASDPSQPGQPATSVQAAPANPNVIQMGDRIERKRAAPQPPAAASKVASSSPATPSFNASAVVNQMRKSRGQPPIN